jgi:hypothetical protein
MMKRRFSLFLMVCALVAVAASPAHASSLCDGLANNRLLNCGFELNNNLDHTVFDWTLFNPNASVETELVHSGNVGYFLGGTSGDSGPATGIAQTFADVAGQTYTVAFWVQYGLPGTQDANAFFHASLDGVQEVSLSGSPNPAPSFTQFGFSFTGTGSDTIRFDAVTNPSEWALDDVSVIGPAPGGSAPEPASWMLLGLGLSCLMLGRRAYGRAAGRSIRLSR